MDSNHHVTVNLSTAYKTGDIPEDLPRSSHLRHGGISAPSWTCGSGGTRTPEAFLRQLKRLLPLPLGNASISGFILD